MFSIKNIDTEPKYKNPPSILQKSKQLLIPLIIVPLLLILLLSAYIVSSQGKQAQKALFDSTAKNIESIANTHLAPLEQIVTLLEDCDAVRKHMHTASLHPKQQFSSAKNLEDVISFPYTYRSLFEVPAIHAVSLYIDDHMEYYSINSDKEGTIERLNSISYYYSAESFPTGTLCTYANSEYVYYICDFRDIYTNTYYGQFIIELTPIPDTVSATSIRNFQYPYKIDLTTHKNLQYYICNQDDTIIFTRFAKNVGDSYNDVVSGRLSSSEQSAGGDENNTLLYTATLDCDATLYVLAPLQHSTTFTPWISVFIILFCCIILGIILLILFYASIHNEVHHYYDLSREYPLSVPDVQSTCSETKTLLTIINERIDDINALKEEYDNCQLQLKDSKIQSLESQMNPHFVYNALDIIHWQAVAAGASDIMNTVDTLASMLRKDIFHRNTKRTLRHELQFTKEYLIFQQTQHDVLFTFSFNVDDSILDEYYIPANTVQPIVENCIQHGFSDGCTDGSIVIDLWEDTDGIFIRVTDNGIGFDPSILSSNKDASSASVEKNNNIAIQNIQKRLKMYYGEDYGISFSSSPGIGTIATIYLPFDTNQAK